MVVPADPQCWIPDDSAPASVAPLSQRALADAGAALLVSAYDGPAALAPSTNLNTPSTLISRGFVDYSRATGAFVASVASPASAARPAPYEYTVPASKPDPLLFMKGVAVSPTAYTAPRDSKWGPGGGTRLPSAPVIDVPPLWGVPPTAPAAPVFTQPYSSRDAAPLASPTVYTGGALVPSAFTLPSGGPFGSFVRCPSDPDAPTVYSGPGTGLRDSLSGSSPRVMASSPTIGTIVTPPPPPPLPRQLSKDPDYTGLPLRDMIGQVPYSKPSTATRF